MADVTQADQDAAADFFTRAPIYRDKRHLAEAFARHRIAARRSDDRATAAEPVVSALRDGIPSASDMANAALTRSMSLREAADSNLAVGGRVCVTVAGVLMALAMAENRAASFWNAQAIEASGRDAETGPVRKHEIAGR